MLTAAPKANGFYRAGMIKKYIPGVYRVNEEKILAKGEERLRMYEYNTEGCTFHAKGAWFYNTKDPSTTNYFENAIAKTATHVL
jgi:hypothetical protein